MSYFDMFPDEIKSYIYSLDITFKFKFDDCIKELSNNIKTHKMILFTYNTVVEEDKKYFKNFSPNFSKYFFLKLHAL